MQSERGKGIFVWFPHYVCAAMEWWVVLCSKVLLGKYCQMLFANPLDLELTPYCVERAPAHLCRFTTKCATLTFCQIFTKVFVLVKCTPSAQESWTRISYDFPITHIPPSSSDIHGKWSIRILYFRLAQLFLNFILLFVFFLSSIVYKHNICRINQ